MGRKKTALVIVLFSVLIPLSIISKDLVARARPDISHVTPHPELDRSYPSGYSIIVAMEPIMLALLGQMANYRICCDDNGTALVCIS
jgi:hypothetical protein